MITRPCPSYWTHGSPWPRRAWSGPACAWMLGTTMRRPRSGSPRPDYTPHIRRRGEASPAHDPRVEPRRWPVERTHAWHNRFRRLLIRWEKKAENWLALIHLANALIAFRACYW